MSAERTVRIVEAQCEECWTRSPLETIHAVRVPPASQGGFARTLCGREAVPRFFGRTYRGDDGFVDFRGIAMDCRSCTRTFRKEN